MTRDEEMFHLMQYVTEFQYAVEDRDAEAVSDAREQVRKLFEAFLDERDNGRRDTTRLDWLMAVIVLGGQEMSREIIDAKMAEARYQQA